MKKKSFCCQECAATYSKWTGRCEQCGAWNTIHEEVVVPSSPGTSSHGFSFSSGGGSFPLEAFFTKSLQDIKDYSQKVVRFVCGLGEFDRVCGGGLVQGSCILISGEPGIGKSTITLQVAAMLSHHYGVWYISGEESCEQVYHRASRLGFEGAPLRLSSYTRIDDILSAIHDITTSNDQSQALPQCIIIDSIQTMYSSHVDAAAGTVSQVRYCTLELVRMAKGMGITLILVGHVTKEGNIAGPRVLEHMVDTVLYFEGDRQYDFRLLRCVKNRYGSTDEVGVFSMGASGLISVDNPSTLFLPMASNVPITGSCIFAGIEGNRPIFCEVQALVAPSFLPSPRRTTVGWDHNRLSTLLAVLEARGKFKFSNKDVYLNIAGGLRISDPAVDLAVATALVSSLLHRPIQDGGVFFGEIALSGCIRAARFVEPRLKEARRLQYQYVAISSITPKTGEQHNHLKVQLLHHVSDIGQILVQ